MNQAALDKAMAEVGEGIHSLVRLAVVTYIESLPKEERATATPILENGPYTVDLDSGKFFKNGVELRVSKKQLQGIVFFMQRKGQLITNRQIMKGIWGQAYNEDNVHYWRVMVAQLRKKTHDGDFIIAVTGQGYRMEVRHE